MYKLTIVALLFLSLNASGQQKGDNAIIIKDANVSIDDLKNSFIRNGFTIESSDANYVSTGVVQRKGHYGVKYAAFKEADSIILKGWIMPDSSQGAKKSNEMEAIVNVGSKGTRAKDSFMWMKQFADLRSKNVYCKRF